MATKKLTDNELHHIALILQSKGTPTGTHTKAPYKIDQYVFDTLLSEAEQALVVRYAAETYGVQIDYNNATKSRGNARKTSNPT